MDTNSKDSTTFVRSSIIHNESLRELTDKLLQELKNLGYSDATCSNYFRRLRPIQTFMSENGIEQYTPSVGNDYLSDYFSKHHPCRELVRAIKAAVARLNDCAEGQPYRISHSSRKAATIPSLFVKEWKEFLSLCRNQKNSDRTLRRKEHALAVFLCKCEKNGVADLRDLTPEIVMLCTFDATDRWQWYIVRDFLKFLAMTNCTEADLSTFVPRLSREFKLPSTYTVDEIKTLESSVDRSSDVGKRDFAIIVLASRYGIRGGDIAAMDVSNLDFAQETICFVTEKTHEYMKFPMVSDVKNALQDHLKTANIHDGPLFRRILPPFSPLTGASVSRIISDHMRKAGIDCNGKKHGPQSLRSSMASSMVNDGVPYEAVRKVLGHNSSNAIKHYAKVDIERLRRCAIVPPAEKGRFQLFLEGGVPIAEI